MAKQVKKPTAKKKQAARRRPAKPDQSQIALSVVERAIGGTLASTKPVT